MPVPHPVLACEMLRVHARTSGVDLFSTHHGGATATPNKPHGSRERGRLLASTAIFEGGYRCLQTVGAIALETEEQGAEHSPGPHRTADATRMGEDGHGQRRAPSRCLEEQHPLRHHGLVHQHETEQG
jgi:hypothetical protein